MRVVRQIAMFMALMAVVVVPVRGQEQAPPAARPAARDLPLQPTAQQTRGGGPGLPDMQTIATALGVSCEYCHAGRGQTPRTTANGKPRLQVAREMIALTADLSARVQAATGKADGDAVRVACITCHRGVAIPRQLQDIMWQTTRQQGADAAATLYRELRAQYYGRQSYDFGEDTLVRVADRLASTVPDAAVTLMQLNIEFYPRSARSYVILAIAQDRQGETTTAIGSLEKALELDPSDGMARGRLYQMQQDLERRQRRR